MTREKLDKRMMFIILLYVSGVIMRYWAMSIGSGFDFESYCIVGELASHFKSVYAGTTRYNYGPIFFIIQGLAYAVSHIFTTDLQGTYRVILVGIFTLTDFGIAMWLANRYSIKVSLIFFLNPISIVITGFHNQFDNMAIFLALLSCQYYNEEEEITKKDWMFVLMLALSLTMKHIIFMIPFWLLVKRGLPVKKRLLYVFVPPMLFGFSFIPFVIGNVEALKGVIYNVFLYKSNAISPLLGGPWGIPLQFYFSLYLILMMIMGCLLHRQSYEYLLLLYFISMFTFSSSMAPQYYIIPIVTLCVLDKGIIRNIYFIFVGGLLLISEFGSTVLNGWAFGMSVLDHIANVAVWVTFSFIITEIVKLYLLKKRCKVYEK